MVRAPTQNRSTTARACVWRMTIWMAFAMPWRSWVAPTLRRAISMLQPPRKMALVRQLRLLDKTESWCIVQMVDPSTLGQASLLTCGQLVRRAR